jgi:hypothetical protein
MGQETQSNTTDTQLSEVHTQWDKEHRATLDAHN